MNTVSKKISVFQGNAITLILAIAILGITFFVKKAIISDVENQYKSKVNDIKSTFEVLNESITQSAVIQFLEINKKEVRKCLV